MPARVRLTWNDNSITETSFTVQRSTDGTTWTDVGTSQSPLDQPNTKGTRALTDTNTYNAAVPVKYRVVAKNLVGYGGQFMSMTAQSMSETISVGGTMPSAPTNLAATVMQTGPRST